MPSSSFIILSSLLLLWPAVASATLTLADVKEPTGPSRRWSAGMDVTQYSQVDLNTGRVSTGLPVVGWGGRGPGISLSLYHHMTRPWGKPDVLVLKGDANLDGELDAADIDPFVDILLDAAPTQTEIAIADFNKSTTVDTGDLDGLMKALSFKEGGPLWTHTYQTCLSISPAGIMLIAGNGTKDYFTANAGGGYDAPAGVFSTLAAIGDPVITGYVLTSTSQTKVYFLADGKLDAIEDASGNRVTCTYIDNALDPANGELDFVTDAAGRVLDFGYSTLGRLSTFQAPFGDASNPTYRIWTLYYQDTLEPLAPPIVDGDGPFVEFADPMDHRIKMTYTKYHDIETITNKNGHGYRLEYTEKSGRLETVTDPAGRSHGIAYVQDGTYHYGTYTDIRNGTWTAKFDPATGNVHSQTNPLGEETRFAYDAPEPSLAHEATTVTDALSHSRTATFDPVSGNLLTTTDAMDHQTTYSYDSLNNLETVTPPGEAPFSGNLLKRLVIRYEDLSHPTSPTLFIEANGAAATQLAYYGPETPESNGLLKAVTDPNGVETEFVYDAYGQLRKTSEGPISELGTQWLKVVEESYSDMAGNVRSSWRGEVPTYNDAPPPDDGDGSGRACRFAVCQDYAFVGPPQSTCCCCIVWCVDGPCNPDSVGCSSGGAPGAGEGPAGGRGAPQLCPPYHVGGTLEGPGYFDYDGEQQLTNVDSWFGDSSISPATTFNLDVILDYDVLERLRSTIFRTDEPTWNTPHPGTQINRFFNYDYDDLNGASDRTGPDSQVTHMQKDLAGRIETISRADMSAAFTYRADGRVETVSYGNGAGIINQYDDAGRLTQARHEWTADHGLILQLDYVHSADGLITSLTETGKDGWSAVTTYTHDNLNRLIEEARGGTHANHLSYTYDEGGNRLTKTDWLADVVMNYHYDLEDPALYQTKNNRLMYYEVFAAGELIERIEYVYDAWGAAVGNPSLTVREVFNAAGPSMFYATDFQYNKQGEVWFETQRQWSGDDTFCENQTITRITEYRGNGRQRRMVRQRDPANNDVVLPGTTRWSDYDGETIYGDYVVDEATGDLTDVTAYLPGIAQMDTQTGDIQYTHTDQIGSLRVLTTTSGQPIQNIVHTAFGEPVHADGTVGTRYQYAGAWGYETSENSPLVHVGHRYYDPSAGRFMQRDPIGILGGLNVYAYVRNSPTNGVDPGGHDPLPTMDWPTDWTYRGEGGVPKDVARRFRGQHPRIWPRPNTACTRLQRIAGGLKNIGKRLLGRTSLMNMFLLPHQKRELEILITPTEEEVRRQLLDELDRARDPASPPWVYEPPGPLI